MNKQKGSPRFTLASRSERVEAGLAPILIILLIAVASVGGYLIYQKQFKPVAISQSSPSPVATPSASSSAETVDTEASQSANWKTYTNNMFNFSFKYPTDWNVNESKVGIILDKVGASAAILNIRPKDNKGTYVTDDIGRYFFVTKVNPDLPITELVKKDDFGGQYFPGNDYIITKIDIFDAIRKNTNITQDLKNYDDTKKQQSGFRGGGGLPVGYKSSALYIKKDDLLFEISSGRFTNSDLEKQFDQILSTFRFDSLP